MIMSGETSEQPPQGKQIMEIETKDRVIRAANKVLGLFGRGLYSSREFVIPDILDQKVEQPLGISVLIRGPKRNLRVFCRTPTTTISFADIAPPKTIFTIHEPERVEPWKIKSPQKTVGYEASSTLTDERKIFIPFDLEILKDKIVYAIIHEAGHLWGKEDYAMLKPQRDAERFLEERKKLSNSSGTNLSSTHKERDKEIAAWKIILKGETIAAQIAIYIIGRLRASGIDLVPQYKDLESLQEDANKELRSQRQFEQKLVLSREDIESLTNGNLPYPVLKGKIDARITKSLTHTKTTEEEPLKV